MAAQTQYLFTTGSLYYKPTVGTVADLFSTASGIEWAVLQDININITMRKVELSAPPTVSMFPVAVAFVNGSASFTAKVASVNADLLLKVLGLATGQQSTTTSGVQTPSGFFPTGQALVDTVGTVVSIPKMAVLFVGQDADDKPVKFAMPAVRFPGAQIQFQLQNFAVQDLNGEGYPDTNGNVAYWLFDN